MNDNYKPSDQLTPILDRIDNPNTVVILVKVDADCIPDMKDEIRAAIHLATKSAVKSALNTLQEEMQTVLSVLTREEGEVQVLIPFHSMARFNCPQDGLPAMMANVVKAVSLGYTFPNSATLNQFFC